MGYVLVLILEYLIVTSVSGEMYSVSFQGLRPPPNILEIDSVGVDWSLPVMLSFCPVVNLSLVFNVCVVSPREGGEGGGYIHRYN